MISTNQIVNAVQYFWSYEIVQPTFRDDASDKGLGAVLMQMEQGQILPIATIIWPRQSIVLKQYEHLPGFDVIPALRSRWKSYSRIEK